MFYNIEKNPEGKTLGVKRRSAGGLAMSRGLSSRFSIIGIS